MDSSSDDGFTWTKASTNSSDSEDASRMSKMIKRDEEFNHDAELNGTTDYENKSRSERKAKKRKIESKEPDHEDASISPKKKHIKTEPISDVESSKRKKKKKHINTNDTNEKSLNLSYDDDYLNLRVKQEQESFENTFQNKNGNSSVNEECIVNGDIKHEKKSKKKKKKTSDDSQDYSETSNTLSPKKKKNKQHKHLNEDEYTINEDKFSAEETVLQKSFTHIGTTNENCDIEPLDNSLTGSELSSVLPKKKKSKSLNNSDSNNSSDKVKLNDEGDATTPNNHNKNAPRILDRIRFEEDIDSEIEHASNKSEIIPLGLKNFTKNNILLHPVTDNHNSLVINEDDEIWMLKYPNEVDIQHLIDKELIMDNKSKIKINGKTYVGNLEEECGKVAIMSSNNKHFIINTFNINGLITYKKRLPKPHIPEDNIIINHQTDFIPLPETKCRHPLFGSNYKSAIKIPASVAQRLNGDLVPAYNEKRKKKKHKKERHNDSEVQSELACTPKIENQADNPVKKSKKRKHADNNETGVKKAKRIKLEKDSSEVWESEKAIEENLFNF